MFIFFAVHGDYLVSPVCNGCLHSLPDAASDYHAYQFPALLISQAPSRIQKLQAHVPGLSFLIRFYKYP